MRLPILIVTALALSSLVVAPPAEAHPCYGYPVQCGSCEISTKHQHVCITGRGSALGVAVADGLLA